MKSRLAVSVLFGLIAANFASDAAGDLAKLKSWAVEGCERGAEQVRRHFVGNGEPTNGMASGIENRLVGRLDDGRMLLRQNCAGENRPRIAGTISPDGKAITFNLCEPGEALHTHEGLANSSVFRLAGSDYYSESVQFVTTALRQVREVVALMESR